MQQCSKKFFSKKGADETWQADLIDMKNYSPVNEGYT